jgi:F-type H+-transporting ATPase subunit delta
VIEKYLNKLAESRGELSVSVTAATALKPEDTKVIADAVAKSTGKKVNLTVRENPALLGGLQVRIGSRMLDTSLATKLSRLKQALSQAA